MFFNGSPRGVGTSPPTALRLACQGAVKNSMEAVRNAIRAARFKAGEAFSPAIFDADERGQVLTGNVTPINPDALAVAKRHT